jgi:Ca-activated chloride channel homolog
MLVAKIIGVFCLMMAALSAAFAQASGPRVDLSLIVKDKANQSLSTLRKEDVRIFEDGVEQTILSVEKDERPVDLGLAIDASGSFRKFLGAGATAAKSIIHTRRSDDQVFIERFVDTPKIQRVQDFTGNKDVLVQAIDKFYVEGGPSAVVDAVYTAVNYVAEHNKAVPGRRKAVILITDGEDRNSAYKAEKLIALLRRHQVQVFVLGFTLDLDESSATKVSPRLKAEKLLKSIAEESGGRVFFPRDDEQVMNATLQFIADLSTQFRVTYQSSNDDPNKTFRKVEVKVTSPDGEKRTAIVPRGYLVQSKPIETKLP